jgi:glutaredoxin 3
VPQVFIGASHLGGYDDVRALDAAGGLDPLHALSHSVKLLEGEP